MSVSDDLAVFAALVRKWNQKINLVARGDIEDVVFRHVEDSEQVFHVKHSWVGKYLDIGSGGGFPAIPIAIHLRHHGHRGDIVLIESDQRKCAFLRTVSRTLNLSLNIRTARIEEIEGISAKTITARALAKVNTLCEFADMHLAEGGTALFPKGQNWEAELQDARRNWQFQCKAHPSKTNPESRILELSEIKRVEQN